MANHQEPDFTTVTDSFFEASQQPTVATSFLSTFITSATGGGGAIVPDMGLHPQQGIIYLLDDTPPSQLTG
jgi:hypothetical protein